MAKGCAPVPFNQRTQPPSVFSAVDAEEIQAKWLSYFESLDDPRGKQGQAHPFLSIVLIAVLAVIGGATGWDDIEVYAVGQEQWLATFLDLRNGVPHADTYRRVFGQIEPSALQDCFLAWVNHIVEETGGQVIPIDGKRVRGSYDREQTQSALHVVSAWASENRIMLGQVKVEDKTNEIKAIPALLALLDISGCIITIDAMGTQTDIAARIVEQKADYVLSLKANHPTLYKQVKTYFERVEAQGFEGIEYSYDQRVDSGHHRTENRKLWAVPVSHMGGLYQENLWAGLRTVVMIIRVRHLWNQVTREVQFYLTSLPCDAQRIGRAIRLHWGIENQLHWVLDVTFAEDDSRIRRGHGPENFTLLRRMALSVLNQEMSSTRSLRQKAKLAAINNDYMMKVLASASSQ